MYIIISIIKSSIQYKNSLKKKLIKKKSPTLNKNM